MPTLSQEPELGEMLAPPLPSAALSSVLEELRAPNVRSSAPTASSWSVSHIKRMVDCMIASVLLAIVSPLMLIIAICVRLTSPGPALFVQHRVGQRGRLFRIYKFRTMAAVSSDTPGPGLTRDRDNRITGIGRWLRKLKLDELPQLFNILLGDMSMVGPRPKLPQYHGITNMPYRPGITGPATIAFRSEEQILSRVHPSEQDEFYYAKIMPLKDRIDTRYMNRASFRSDLQLIGVTIMSCLWPGGRIATFRIVSSSEKSYQPEHLN